MSERLTICKYGIRYWALYDSDTLVCVTLYRKGALEVRRRLQAVIIDTAASTRKGFTKCHLGRAQTNSPPLRRKEKSAMETIATTNPIDYQNLIEESQGKFFIVEFTKKNGEFRRLLGRTGVKLNSEGNGLKFNPADRGLLSIDDVQNQGYRFVNLASITYFRCGQLLAGKPRQSEPVEGEARA
jgi:hypothetical protein